MPLGLLLTVLKFSDCMMSGRLPLLALQCAGCSSLFQENNVTIFCRLILFLIHEFSVPYINSLSVGWIDRCCSEFCLSMLVCFLSNVLQCIFFFRLLPVEFVIGQFLPFSSVLLYFFWMVGPTSLHTTSRIQEQHFIFIVSPCVYTKHFLIFLRRCHSKNTIPSNLQVAKLSPCDAYMPPEDIYDPNMPAGTWHDGMPAGTYDHDMPAGCTARWVQHAITNLESAIQ